MTIVGPLLAGLRAYTGYTLNLMAGRIDGTNYEGRRSVFYALLQMNDVYLLGRSANAGVVKGKDWAQWDSVGYGSAVHTYVKFVHAVHLGK
jgi:hypothetical protein